MGKNNNEELIAEIQKKKELSGISAEVIEEILKNKLNKLNLQDITPSEEKQIIKEARAELRTLVGQFQLSLKKRKAFLNEKNWQEILNTHLSTKERIASGGYKIIKNIIKNHNISSILDIGCGLNPIALATPDIYYIALDIKQDELEIIKQFFKDCNIKGQTISFDIRNIENMGKLPKAELCLILKVFDIIETKGHKLAEKIITNLNCKHILVSFPTKKLSGKNMNFPRRIWLEKLLNRLNYSFTTSSTTNEIFYLVDKKCNS